MKRDQNDKKKKKYNKLSKMLNNLNDDARTSDILGSYTGKPVDGIIPEQDADDL